MSTERSDEIFFDMFAEGIKVIERSNRLADTVVTEEEHYQYLLDRGYNEDDIELVFNLKKENGRVYEV